MGYILAYAILFLKSLRFSRENRGRVNHDRQEVHSNDSSGEHSLLWPFVRGVSSGAVERSHRSERFREVQPHRSAVASRSGAQGYSKADSGRRWRPRLALEGNSRTQQSDIGRYRRYLQGQQPLRYRLSFTETGSRFELRDEAVENEKPTSDKQDPFFYYRYQDGHPVLNVFTEKEPGHKRHLKREDVKYDQSILSQRRDPTLIRN